MSFMNPNQPTPQRGVGCHTVDEIIFCDKSLGSIWENCIAKRARDAPDLFPCGLDVLAICTAFDFELNCLGCLVAIVCICFQIVCIVLIDCIASSICRDSLLCFVFVDSSGCLCGAGQSCFLFLLRIESVFLVPMIYSGSWRCLYFFNCLYRLDCFNLFWKSLDSLDCLQYILDWVALKYLETLQPLESEI